MTLFTSLLLAYLSIATDSYLVLAEPIAPSSIVELDCGPGIVCINGYGAVLPFPFNRSDGGEKSTYGDTNATNVPGFDKINDYHFVSFDDKFKRLLGGDATYEFMFTVADVTHEVNTPNCTQGPVWIKDRNWILFTQVAEYWQYRIDLNYHPPTLQQYSASPPIYSADGGSFHEGLAYFVSPGGGGQVPSVVTYNASSNEATTILNNYRGVAFNGLDDIVVDPNGNVFFTDPWFGYLDDFNPTPPVLTPGVWFFNTSSGSSKLLDGTLQEPNGIVASPDWSTVYVSDTGVNSGRPPTFHPTGPRTIYAYDTDLSTGSLLNKRTFFINDERDPDGMKIDVLGNLWTASGRGADVIDPAGNLIGKVQTNFTVTNLVFTGDNLRDLWLVGLGGVAKVHLAERGNRITKI
ncbi:related to lactonohydrolase [Phialocephala subalpina]|uniref:Related to lactonohydrolase n=1 Tax=Phialocephala subalpina TaxID=576137 RepID=A0A1L7XUB7_9HELO|nr:related to lactonohydrolase [Phialocephala subalpina]